MAELDTTSISGGGAREAEVNTLTAADTFVYVPGSILIISNDTGSPVTANLLGDEADTVAVRGVGMVDVSDGYDALVPNGESVAIPLDSIARYLTGEAEITGAAGAEAILLVP